MSTPGETRASKRNAAALENTNSLAETTSTAATRDDELAPKRQKPSIGDELICPITLELPFDPVTAEDGRIYERSEIEKYFKSNGNVKSPYTNKPMGMSIFSSPQIKNVIEMSIDNGAITGDLAKKWMDKKKQKDKMDALVKKAKQGDMKSMETLARGYNFGKDGFTQDIAEAFVWYEKVSKLGSERAAACAGHYLVKGIGVAKDFSRGIMYLGIGAERGSDLAAFLLGKAYAKGCYGVKKDKAEGIFWLQKVTNGNCPVKHLASGAHKTCQDLLDKLMNEEG